MKLTMQMMVTRLVVAAVCFECLHLEIDLVVRGVHIVPVLHFSLQLLAAGMDAFSSVGRLLSPFADAQGGCFVHYC